MHRFKTSLFVFSLLLPPAFASVVSEALITVHKRYEKSQAESQQKFDRELAELKKGYISGLEKAGQLETDPAGKKSIEKELESFKAVGHFDPNSADSHPRIETARSWYNRRRNQVLDEREQEKKVLEDKYRASLLKLETHFQNRHQLQDATLVRQRIETLPKVSLHTPEWISKKAGYTVSSQQFGNRPPLNTLLNERTFLYENEYAFHTRKERYPFVLIDLGRPAVISELVIENRRFDETRRAKHLAIWVARKEKPFGTEPDWEAGGAQSVWKIKPNHPWRGRYIKAGLNTDQPEIFHLAKIKVYGQFLDVRESPAEVKPAPVSSPLVGKPVWISKETSYTVSSQAYADKPPTDTLLTGRGPLHEKEYAFQTRKEVYPFIVIDLEQERTVANIYIENRKNSNFYSRAKTLSIWTSPEKLDDMPRTDPIWTAKEGQREWNIDIAPRRARYICIGLRTDRPESFHLAGVLIQGE